MILKYELRKSRKSARHASVEFRPFVDPHRTIRAVIEYYLCWFRAYPSKSKGLCKGRTPNRAPFERPPKAFRVRLRIGQRAVAKK